MKKQTHELQQLFNLAEKSNVETHSNQHKLRKNIQTIIKKYNPKASEQRIYRMSLTLQYLFIHNFIDHRQTQVNKVNQALDE